SGALMRTTGVAWTRTTAAIALAIAVVPALLVTAWPAGPASVRVVALDVGQGDAYLVDAGGVLALIDGGPDPSRILDELGATLAPDPDVGVDVPSLVLRVTRGTFSALFTGDAVDDALRLLLDHPDRLRSRVYVPPHHGAETPFAAALRAAARPEAALISVGA